MLTYVQMQFKSPSRQIGKLLRNCLSNMKLGKASLKNALFFIKSAFCFFPVIKHQLQPLEVYVLQVKKLLVLPSLCKLLIV